MESVPLDSSHFFVPVQPEHWRLNGEEKDIYFSKLLDGVMCVHGASEECKRRILEMRTGLPHLTSELRENFKGLLDPKHAGSREHGVVNMVDDRIFLKSKPQILNAHGRPMALDHDSDTTVPWVIKEKAQFYTFHCIVNGAQAFQGNSDIKSKVETIRLEIDIGLALPTVRQRVPHANYISYFLNNNHAIDVLHSAITLPVLNDPSLLLQQVEAILGFPPAIGYVKKDPGHLHYRIDSTGFYKDYQRYYQRVFLDHYVPCLELEFKAGSVTDLGVIEQQVRAKRQTFIDPDTRAMVVLTVDEFYRSFTNVLGLFRDQAKYSFDIAQTFWQGLNVDIN